MNMTKLKWIINCYAYLTQYTAGTQMMSAASRPKFCKISRYKIVGRSTDHILNYTYIFINTFYAISAYVQHGSVEPPFFKSVWYL